MHNDEVVFVILIFQGSVNCRKTAFVNKNNDIKTLAYNV